MVSPNYCGMVSGMTCSSWLLKNWMNLFVVASDYVGRLYQRIQLSWWLTNLSNELNLSTLASICT